MTTYEGHGRDRPGAGRDRPRVGRAKVRKPVRRGAADLVPAPDETTLLPVISEDEPLPPPPRSKRQKRRSVRRHAVGGGGRPTAGDRVRSVIRGFGELFITFGVIILLFAAYEIWGKTAAIEAHQDDLNSQLEQTWEENSADPAAQPLPGDAFARLYIPKVKDEPWIVVEGITPADIKEAPGHYPETQDAGEKGNFAIAGHNLPAIFRDIDKLDPGDTMVVETGENFYIYEVTEHLIVDPYAYEVVKPVPGDMNSTVDDADKAMMTLTTCHPWWDNYERYIVHGELVKTVPRSEGIPPEAREA